MVDWVKARMHSPLIGEDRVAEVLERFGVRPTSRPANLALSWRNRNVIVHTSAGKKVLKQYRETSNLDTITNEHSIIEHLRQRSFPAVRLNYTLTGGTSVEIEDQYFALFDFESGLGAFTVAESPLDFSLSAFRAKRGSSRSADHARFGEPESPTRRALHSRPALPGCQL